MRKKYLSALLFGALVMASTATFTSCKDYDDDIDQVNTDISAVKTDLSSKMDAVNTSISGLTSAQSEIKGSLSAVNKQIETLTANGAKAVAELKAELQKADADQKAALEAKIAELNTKLEEQVDALNVQAAQLAAQQAQIEGILAELEATKAGIEAANAKLDKAEAELKAGIAANTQSIEELNKQLAEKLAEITEAFNAKIDTELAAVQGEIAALVTVQTNQQGSINNILVELEAISGSLTGNIAAVETLKADIETLKQEMEEKIVASHDKIREEIAAVDAKLATEVDLLKNDLAALALNLAEQKTDLELQKATLEAYKEDLDKADLDLNDKIAGNAKTIADNKEAADKAIADLEVLLNQKVEELGGKIEEIVANHEALKVIVGSLQGDVEEINGDIEDLLDAVLELAAYDAEVEVRLTELEALAAGNAEGVATNKTAIEGLVKELADAKKALEDSDAELKGALGQDIQKLADRVLQLEAGVSDADWDAIKTLVDDAKEELNESIKKNTEDIAAIKKDIDEVIKEDIKKLQEDVEKISKNLGTMTAAVVNGMITNVELMPTDESAGVINNSITFSNVKEKKATFGYDVYGNLLPSYITFTKDLQQPIEQTFEVRVTPASAVLDASRISFVNSKGQVMPNVTATKVVRRENTDKGYITRAASAPTGIWEVTVQLDNYNEDAFNAATLSGGKKICYAMSISNPVDEKGNARNVTTAYDMKFNYQPYTPASALWFKVDDKKITELRNRYDYQGAPKDKMWNTTTPDVWAERNNATKITDDTQDKRRTQERFPAQIGTPFTIQLTDNLYDAENVKQIRALYVTLDKEYAVESAPSEWEAWKTYTYEGLDEVVEGTSTQVTIKSAAVGDIIGFRVYAVNYDGTLVDPDGKSFYVYVGDETSISTASVSFAPNAWTNDSPTFESSLATLGTANWINADNASLVKIYESTDASKTDKSTALGLSLANFYMTMADGTETAMSTVAQLTDADDLAAYTKVKIKNAVMSKLTDGKTYIAEIKLTKTTGTGNNAVTSTIQTVTVEFSKTLPTFPINVVYPFTNVLVNNTLKVYPKKIVSGKALYDIDNVWHGVDNHTTFVQTNVTEENPKTVDYVITNTTPGANMTDYVPAFKVDKNIMRIDNAKYGEVYPMAVKYDFGKVSTGNADGDNDLTTYLTNGTTFNLVFGNYLDDCSYAWNGAAPVLSYPGVSDEETYIDASLLKVTDWYQHNVNLWTLVDSTDPNTQLSGIYANDYAAGIRIDLLTGSNFTTENEYYRAEPAVATRQDAEGNEIPYVAIKLISKVNASQGSPVPTKIRLTITDIYGGTIVKTFDPFTMTFQR